MKLQLEAMISLTHYCKLLFILYIIAYVDIRRFVHRVLYSTTKINLLTNIVVPNNKNNVNIVSPNTLHIKKQIN